jgi:hypothetical protein
VSNKKTGEKERRGGARKDAGRKLGSGKKTKICVSVTKRTWHSALFIWRRKIRQRKPSQLVDRLVSDYVGNNGRSLEMKAV